MMVLLSGWVAISGCKIQNHERPEKPIFLDYYKRLKEAHKQIQKTESNEKKLSLSTQGMTLSAFLRWLSDKGDISCVAEKSLDDAKVVIDVQDQTVSSILSAVSRRLGVQVTVNNGLYYIGKLRPEDRGVYVRKCKRLDADELKAAVAVLLSEHGRQVTYADGVMVVGDKVECLQRINELLDKVEAAPADSWVVQLYLLCYQDTAESDLGVDMSANIELAKVFTTVDQDIEHFASINGIFQALMVAEKNSSSVDMVAQPMFVMLDGREAKYQSGQQLRVPKKNVSDAGTVTTVGYEIIDTGLQVVTGIRDLGKDRARIDLQVDISSVIDYVDDIPNLSKDTFETQACLESGGVYLLGAVEVANITSRKRGMLDARLTDSDDIRTVQIWCRAYRIDGLDKTEIAQKQGESKGDSGGRIAGLRAGDEALKD